MIQTLMSKIYSLGFERTYHWKIREKNNPYEVEKIAQNLKISSLTAELLLYRGIKSVEDAKGWLKYMAENGSLRLKSMRARTLRREGGSDVYELDVTLYGTRASFEQLLNTFGTADKNFTIHKLTINAVDQRNFNKKKYEARLILKIFI